MIIVILVLTLNMIAFSKEEVNKYLINNENSNYFENIVINSKNNTILNMNGFNYSFEKMDKFFKNICIRSNKSVSNKNILLIDKIKINNHTRKLYKIFNIYGIEVENINENIKEKGLYIYIYNYNNKFVSEKFKIE